MKEKPIVVCQRIVEMKEEELPYPSRKERCVLCNSLVWFAKNNPDGNALCFQCMEKEAPSDARFRLTTEQRKMFLNENPIRTLFFEEAMKGMTPQEFYNKFVKNG